MSAATLGQIWLAMYELDVSADAEHLVVSP